MRKRLLFFAIPLIVMLGWFGFLHLSLQFDDAPRWIFDDAESLTVFACADEELLSRFDTQPLSPDIQTDINQDEAWTRIDRLIAAYHGVWHAGLLYRTGTRPRLAEIMLPDGEVRVVWWRAVVTETESLAGLTTVGMIDAETGDPIALFDNLLMELSSSGECSTDATWHFDNSRLLITVALPLVAFVYYVAGILMLFPSIVRRNRDILEKYD